MTRSKSDLYRLSSSASPDDRAFAAIVGRDPRFWGLRPPSRWSRLKGWISDHYRRRWDYLAAPSIKFTICVVLASVIVAVAFFFAFAHIGAHR